MNKIKRFITKIIFGFVLFFVYLKLRLCGDFKPSGLSSSFQGTEELNEAFWITQALLAIDRIGIQERSVLVE